MYAFFEIDFSANRQTVQVCLPIIITLFFFSTYWFIAQSQRIKDWFYRRNSFDQAAVRHIFFTKAAGFVLMGVFPLIVCRICMDNDQAANYGLTYIYQTTFFSVVWICALSLLVVPLTYMSAKKQKSWEQYPQIRARTWTRRTLITDASGWFIYLFGYEFLFRGVLLFPLADALGVWPAIAINIALYSATHIPKGLDETIGAVPLGLVLCILTLQSGTIWIAFWVHVIMAWTNSFTALKYNPETNYLKR